MPLREYRCQDCGNIFEELVPLGSKELVRCPECKSFGCTVQYSPPATRFNGQGFYSTDNGRIDNGSSDRPDFEL